MDFCFAGGLEKKSPGLSYIVYIATIVYSPFLSKLSTTYSYGRNET
jgi:hypothetical protein